ncbi:hypothetical protein HY734_02520 [Candidatus Uhrbacteria bacterium]|nr:hypothetical protein [Candidatus Uhrbacteria bacterium]
MNFYVNYSNVSDDFDEQEKRIALIFELNEAPEANMETLLGYRNFLEKRLVLPVRVTGIEDFDWEEFYVLGPGDKDEYDELKKIQPSYNDVFEMTGLKGEIDDLRGILVNVRRLSDRKTFVLPLADLETVEKSTEASAIVHDYVVWYVNY